MYSPGARTICPWNRRCHISFVNNELLFYLSLPLPCVFFWKKKCFWCTGRHSFCFLACWAKHSLASFALSIFFSWFLVLLFFVHFESLGILLLFARWRSKKTQTLRHWKTELCVSSTMFLFEFSIRLFSRFVWFVLFVKETEGLARKKKNERKTKEKTKDGSQWTGKSGPGL